MGLHIALAVLGLGFDSIRQDTSSSQLILVETSAYKMLQLPRLAPEKVEQWLRTKGWHLEKNRQQMLAISPELWDAWGAASKVSILRIALKSTGPVNLTDSLRAAILQSPLPDSVKQESISRSQVFMNSHLSASFTVTVGAVKVPVSLATPDSANFSVKELEGALADRSTPAKEVTTVLGIVIRPWSPANADSAIMTALPVVSKLLEKREEESSAEFKKLLAAEYEKNKAELDAIAGDGAKGKVTQLSDLPKGTQERILSSLSADPRFQSLLPTGTSVADALKGATVQLTRYGCFFSVYGRGSWWGQDHPLKKFEAGNPPP